MASIKVLLKTDKKAVNDEYPIVIRVTKDRKSNYVWTGKKSSKKHWDESKGLPNKKHPTCTELTIYLNKKVLDTQKEMLRLETDDAQFNGKSLTNVIKRGSKGVKVFDFFEKIIEERRQAGRINTSRNYTSARNALLKFTDSKTLTFYHITTDFLMNYENFHRERGIKESTIKFFFVWLKMLYREAVKKEAVKDDNTAIKQFKMGKFKCHPNHRAIGKSNIEAIINFQVEDQTKQFHYLNYFIFSYYCWGMNMVDVSKLTWKNIEGGRIIYHRSKTKKRFNIPITPPLKKILDYYRYNTLSFQDYVFPILKENHSTPTQVVNRIKDITKYTNRFLKTVSDELGIPFKVTTYMARHTFASNLQQLDVSAARIQHMLGHRSEITTQTYLDGIKNKELDEAAMLLVE